MATLQKLDELAQGMVQAKDPAWSADYYLLHYRIQEVLPHLRGPNVLELGCAEGGMTRAIGERFPNVIAVDGSPNVLELAQRDVRLPNVQFVCSLLENFEPDGKFNSIVAACILEHVEHVVPILKRALRWLADDGAIHIVVPNAGALNRRIGKAMGLISELDELHERDRRQGHYRVYSFATLEADVNAAGLQVTRRSGIYLKPLADSQMKGWDNKLLDAFFAVGKELPEYCSEIYFECRPRRA